MFAISCLVIRDAFGGSGSHIPSTLQVAELPQGVRAVWDIDKTYRETTSTRERICLNGLWRWQPATLDSASVPGARWGYFKVPGCWPGISDYLQKDSQTVFTHPDWKNERPANITSAWYQREFTVPPSWKGRRITLSAEYLNSFAVVYLDGKKAGEMRFPVGEVDLTSPCKPGGKYVLSMLVAAMPLKAVMTSYTDTNAAREVRGNVARRGLCGDVFLNSAPSAARISDVRIETSVRTGEITFRALLEGLTTHCIARADIKDKGKPTRSFVFPMATTRGELNGRWSFTQKWKPDRLWDLHTPQNKFTAQLTLIDSTGKVLDVTQPVPFGFREFWIKGRDFYLNGSRIFLSAIPLDNAQVGTASASYAGARETFERMKSFGINFVYTHNYDCEPGSHLSFEEILRAADDTGMLVALSQPHFSAYDWKSPDAEKTNGYAQHAQFYCKVAQNYPSVVAYAMSHNATGYEEMMNPDLMDGKYERRDTWSTNNAQKALRAEAIVKKLDPTRIVYHHSSGNLGSMHTANFYVNFVPPQEMDDWFEHWSTTGTKPLFLCEYGVPFSWDWTMYRGWYKGKREWGSARVPWEFCAVEWNAQFLGDAAYNITDMEKANIRWEARQFKTSDGWHRWDYPNQVGTPLFEDRNKVFAKYISDNWRAFRTWELSANSPWEYEIYWRTRPGLDRKRNELPVDWDRLQRPGFSPDYVDSQFETMPTAYQRTDWIPTVAGEALIRNNRPLLAYIGGKSGAITSKDHNFLPGETVEKQLVLINNSRVSTTADCRWTLATANPIAGSKIVSIRTGEQVRVPMQFQLPTREGPIRYVLKATVRFSSGEVQTDTFDLDILPRPAISTTTASPKIGLFDPKGETAATLKKLGIRVETITPDSDLSSFSLVILGKHAIDLTNRIPNITRLDSGLKVIIFEQDAAVLEQRMGFRVAEYGLRRAFPRIADHPLLEGLVPANLQDWHGEATNSPPRLQYAFKPMLGPVVKWCGMEVPRVWRCGNRGNVASVLIEKPARGDFLPIVDGGYALQYSPLIQFREGKGSILFCQLDVTGRTESEPSAERLVRNMVDYMARWKAGMQRKVFYSGDPDGKRFLESIGVASDEPEDKMDPDRSILIIAPGAAKHLKRDRMAAWLKDDGRVLAMGLKGSEANAFMPFAVQTKSGEHIASYFEATKSESRFSGICPADIHNRDPHDFYLITDGADALGDGILATSPDERVVFCQMVPWQFNADKPMNQKRTFRRAAFLLSRIMANLGAASSAPLVDNLIRPLSSNPTDKRWLSGLYLDVPEEWDDPYRFFEW